MPKSFCGARLTQQYPKLETLRKEGSSLSMVFRKLFPRVLIASLALATLSTSTFAQTRPRVTVANNDASEVSASPDAAVVVPAAVVTAAKPSWDAKPKPTIDVTPTIGVSYSAFFKFQPLLIAAIDER